ncbi:MAG: AmiS/UreI family transporter [Lachnospiraceae bacterium]
MILGLVMFIVGAVFLVNIAYAFGKCERVENGVFNLIFGVILLFLILTGIVKEWKGPSLGDYPTAALWWAAQVLLFAMTYVFLGVQRIKNFDGRVVGWWCLFVVINVPLPTYQTFMSGDALLGVIWIIWGWLWLIFFVTMGLQKFTESQVALRVTQVSMIVGFLISLWIPSLYMLNGWW